MKFIILSFVCCEWYDVAEQEQQVSFHVVPLTNFNKGILDECSGVI